MGLFGGKTKVKSHDRSGTDGVKAHERSLSNEDIKIVKLKSIKDFENLKSPYSGVNINDYNISRQ